MKPILKIFLLFGFMFSIYANVNAQPTTWQRVFGLDSNVQGSYGIQTLEGGYLILGKWSHESVYPGHTRAIKLDQFGNLIWMKNYPFQISNSVIQDSDSTYILVGPGGGLFKINNKGDSIIYRGYSMSRINSIKKYYDGGFVIEGDASVARLNNNLDVMWLNYYNDSNYKNFSLGEEFVFDSNNNIAFPCIGYDVMTGLGDGGIVKLNPDGSLYLRQFYNTPSRDGFGYIKKVGDNYALGGSANSIITYYALIDTNGSLITSRYYDDPLAHYAILVNSTFNNLAFVGFDHSNSQTKMSVRKINYLGNIIWTRAITNALHVSAPSAAIATSDQGYLLTGIYENSITHKFSTYVVKCDSNAYADPIGISNQTTQIPDRFTLHPAYPNPFNSGTKIKYEIKQSGNYKMEIFDINGKLVSLIFNERLNAGFYEKSLSDYFDQLSSSVYFLRLSDFTLTKTQRLLLIK